FCRASEREPARSSKVGRRCGDPRSNPLHVGRGAHRGGDPMVRAKEASMACELGTRMTLNRLSMKRSRWPIFEARAVWLLACAMSVLAVVMPARAAEREEDYYRILTYPTPDGVQFEPGALTITPSGELAIATRIGEIWIASNAFTDDPRDIEYKLFASGLHEPLGLTTRDGVLWATQRGEVTKIIDLDGDGLADRFETVSDDWGLTSDYHEYAFGSPFDRDGNIWIVLCLTGSFTSQAPFRGWCVRVSADGTFQPTAGGVRSPGGIGCNHEGEAFYTDNQGPWNGACSLKHLRPGFCVGHPIG